MYQIIWHNVLCLVLPFHRDIIERSGRRIVKVTILARIILTRMTLQPAVGDPQTVSLLWATTTSPQPHSQAPIPSLPIWSKSRTQKTPLINPIWTSTPAEIYPWKFLQTLSLGSTSQKKRGRGESSIIFLLGKGSKKNVPFSSLLLLRGPATPPLSSPVGN